MVSAADQNENTPLLESSQSPRSRVSRIIPRWTWIQWRVMLIAAFLMLSVNFGHFMGTAPQLKLFEDIICQNHKRSLDQKIPHGEITFYSNICKSEPVQSELALVSGWKNTLDVLPALALALPYGVLADKIGRRPFVIISTAATALSECWPRLVCWFNLPLRLVWLTGLFRAPGGGDQFATFMLMTIIADVFDEKERATALFRLVSLPIVAEVVATPISASTMNIDPWIPFMIGPVIVLVGALLSVLVPETLNQSKSRLTLEDLDDREILEPLQTSPSKDNVFRVVINKAERFVTETEFMWKNTKLLISLAIVFVGILDKSSLFLLIQYASTKYHWSISRASYLISIRGCMTLATFLVLMPLLSSFLLQRLHYSTLKKDLTIAKIAAVSGIIGYSLIFVASNSVPLTIGCLFVSFSMPFVVAITSVATSFTPAEYVATLYTALSVSQSIGITIAGPTFAKLYSAGMHIGLEWSGLPFGVAAALYAVIMIALMFLRR